MFLLININIEIKLFIEFIYLIFLMNFKMNKLIRKKKKNRYHLFVSFFSMNPLYI